MVGSIGDPRQDPEGPLVQKKIEAGVLYFLWVTIGKKLINFKFRKAIFTKTPQTSATLALFFGGGRFWWDTLFSFFCRFFIFIIPLLFFKRSFVSLFFNFFTFYLNVFQVQLWATYLSQKSFTQFQGKFFCALTSKIRSSQFWLVFTCSAWLLFDGTIFWFLFFS